MRTIISGLLLSLLSALAPMWLLPAAHAQGGGPSASAPRIEWEVKNRFRLFRNETDFQRHVAATRNDGVLGAERRLAISSDGRGWARDIVERLCVDRAGRLTETCDRDGTRENYFSPRDHAVGLVLAGAAPANVRCVWSFEDGAGDPRQVEAACEDEVRIRVAYGKTTNATLDIALPDGTAQRVVTEIAVRDVLIAGMGDSIAAGEGNPDRAVRLADEGFCFRRFLAGNAEYYRPGRAGYSGNRSCADDASNDADAANWARQSARWESGPCHRSLYSYQTRAALALAVESPHIAVTYLPLACSGATISAGFLGGQKIVECASPGTAASCPDTTRAQITELNSALGRARAANAERKLDLVLLTIGANDIRFSGLVGHVIIEARTERTLLGRGGNVATVPEAQKILDGNLPGDFARLRAALKPLVGGNLSRVVFVSYGHPALAAPDTPCPGGRDGFDVHPAFGADGNRLREVVDFVSDQFLPKMKALALCEGRACRDQSDRMTFVDAHQRAFAEHGVCTRAADDPPFDRECFSQNGDSFDRNPATAATDPMACGRGASEYRPYAPRQRWVRTANDSYFTAMTYPQGLGTTLQPSNIHDATWGVLAAVYGGAIHPSAEGHAAMADAAMPAVREVLGLEAPVERGNDAPPPVPLDPTILQRQGTR
jgi:lysophospholipase L1-like esterase